MLLAVSCSSVLVSPDTPLARTGPPQVLLAARLVLSPHNLGSVQWAARIVPAQFPLSNASHSALRSLSCPSYGRCIPKHSLFSTLNTAYHIPTKARMPASASLLPVKHSSLRHSPPSSMPLIPSLLPRSTQPGIAAR